MLSFDHQAPGYGKDTQDMNANAHKDILDNLTTAVLQVDRELQICYLNPAAESLLAVSGQRLLGEPISSLSSDIGETIPLQEALNEGLGFTQREIPLQTPHGQLIHVDCTVTPLLLNDRQQGILIELQNVDHKLRISREQGLLASQQSSRALIRGLAHEIKNPLGGLRGAAQLLAKQLPDPDLTEYTRVIIDEADRLVTLVDQLLSPHSQLQTSAVNIHEITERVRQLLIAESGDAIVFRRDYDPSLPELMGDKSQLIQATLNIARNAMQALLEQHREQPEIIFRTRAVRQFTIGTRTHRLVCRIEIIDNGPGINDEMKKMLFMPMVSGRAQGSGLGLAIAQTIVHHHNGIIEYQSEPGHTVFSINIPLESIA